MTNRLNQFMDQSELNPMIVEGQVLLKELGGRSAPEIALSIIAQLVSETYKK